MEAKFLSCGDIANMADELFDWNAELNLLFRNRELRACPTSRKKRESQCQRAPHRLSITSVPNVRNGSKAATMLDGRNGWKAGFI